MMHAYNVTTRTNVFRVTVWTDVFTVTNKNTFNYCNNLERKYLQQKGRRMYCKQHPTLMYYCNTKTYICSCTYKCIYSNNQEIYFSQEIYFKYNNQYTDTYIDNRNVYILGNKKPGDVLLK